MRAALLLACLCLACESAPTPTETIVVVDADSSIRALASKLHARVQGASDEIVRFDAGFEPRWPVRLAIVPLGGDAKREFELTITAARADGTTLVDARVHTGFMQGEKRYHRVLLSEDCVGRMCSESSTCTEGACVSAHVPAQKLAASVCMDASCRESSGAEKRAERDAAADGAPEDAEAAAACGSMELTCAGGCVARDSLEHCGACDRDCSKLPNVAGATRCDSDRCRFEPSACSPGHGDCNGDPEDGCETELNEPSHCGACGETCEEPQLCAAQEGGHGHRCVEHCPHAGQTTCDGRCVDLATDPKHCGACGATCESGAPCEAGHCGEPCTASGACKVSECRAGVTRCDASGPVCEAAERLPDGMACGASGSCSNGQCTCGISDGRGGPFSDCSSDADCSPGTACSDWNGSGQFLCRPLCESANDCAAWGGDGGVLQEVRCAAARCDNGADPRIRVCVELDGKLAPAYNHSSCCGGPGSAGVSAEGCSDGTREAFTDQATFPSVAGCEAKWPLASMRDPTSGVACGNSIGIDCRVPADACAAGWHVCGAPPYQKFDILNKLSAEECNSQPGRYAMALADTDCEPCTDKGTGAACCGVSCVQGYKSCVFPGQTAWFGWDGSQTNLCGRLLSTAANQGVMCCRGYL